jgi:hypothetical protein
MGISDKTMGAAQNSDPEVQQMILDSQQQNAPLPGTPESGGIMNFIKELFGFGSAEASDFGSLMDNNMLQGMLNPKTPTLGETYFDRVNRTSPIVDDQPYPPLFFPNDQQGSVDIDRDAMSEFYKNRFGVAPIGDNTGIINAARQITPAMDIRGDSVANFQGFFDKEDFSQPPQPSGLRSLISSLSPLNLLRRIAGSGQPFKPFTPGTRIRNGIVNVAGVNTPYSAFGGDFFDQKTGTNRFDRAMERFKKTGSMKDLFAASRSGAEFRRRRREELEKRERRAKIANKKKIANQQYFGGDDTSSGGNRDIGSRVSQSYESIQDDDYGLI